MRMASCAFWLLNREEGWIGLILAAIPRSGDRAIARLALYSWSHASERGCGVERTMRPLRALAITNTLPSETYREVNAAENFTFA